MLLNNSTTIVIALSAFCLVGCSGKPPATASAQIEPSHKTDSVDDPKPGAVIAPVATPATALEPPKAPPFMRPALAISRGQYFSWSAPASWTSSESMNGVDMKSADGKYSASSVLLAGNRGSNTPWSFLSQVLPLAGIAGLKKLSETSLPSMASGYPGLAWQVKSFETRYTDPTGKAKLGEFTVGILNAYGGYSAIVQAYAADPDAYDHAKTWLPVIAGSVKALNPNNIAGQQNVLPARNHPLDNSGLIASWHQKSLSEDRISLAQREGMMGYEKVKSEAGTTFNMPLETYDGTVGGYHNPTNPTEILKKAAPGD